MKRASGTLLLAAIALACLTSAVVQARQSIPAGTQIQVRLLTPLDTSSAKAGQTFSASVAQPVVVKGKTVLARGANLTGRVTEAVSSGRLKRPASITLELTSPASEPLRIDEKSHFVRNVALIGGGTAAGAVLGGVAGGKKGAAIGAAIGAGAGTTTAYVTGKKEIVLPAETLLGFVAAGVGTAAMRPEPQAEASSQAAGTGRGTSRQAPVFSERDQELIRQYFEVNTANLPPGLAKRGGKLPPGLERHLERNGTLPPGLQKRVQPFPLELSRQLPPLPAGYSRVILGVRAIILDRGNRILDLMYIR